MLLHIAPGEMVHLRNAMRGKKVAEGKDAAPLPFSKRGSLGPVRNNHLLDHRIIESQNGKGWKGP